MTRGAREILGLCLMLGALCFPLTGCDQLGDLNKGTPPPKKKKTPPPPPPVEGLEQDAQAGKVKAMVELADAYATGSKGADKDLEQARAWYLKAAEIGDPYAMTKVAGMCEAGEGGSRDITAARQWYMAAAMEDVGKAKRWLEKQAESGDGKALAALGKAALANMQRTDSPDAREKYRAMALDYLTKGAAAGDPLAAAERGLLELDAPAPEAKAAAEWLKVGAETDPRAMTALGDLHRDGRGVPRSVKRAFELYQQAAGAEHPEALARLGDCYAHGRGVARDIEQAQALYQQAADADNPAGMAGLGRLLISGQGKGTPEEGKTWLGKAAEAGDLDAARFLGDHALVGQLVDDLPYLIFTQPELTARAQAGRVEAEKWYQLAAKSGLVRDLKKLGDMYCLTTEGHEPNLTKAMKYGYQPALKIIEQRKEAGDLPADLADLEKSIRAWAGAALFNHGLDPSVGKTWLYEAEKLGSHQAKFFLGELHFYGLKDTQLDLAKGVKYWLEGAEAGNPLCKRYAEALTTAGEMDPAKVVRFYFERAKDGDGRAKMQLEQVKGEYPDLVPEEFKPPGKD